ncbi:MAG: hypothetical protein F2840_16195 [Actinobacteria bacterium]|uniref:Unannotated protein n=1 Tax=freshwater metagenome TaxID=449393 RepID=A0A6J7LNG3_9ZZZZ|nr:hypothetical protein [Actinomycetota bacterium]
MTYALYPDEWPMHMIRLRLDRSDRHLFTELLTHCTRNLTDGLIDVPLTLVTDHADADEAVSRLIAAGLVDRHPQGLVIAQEFLQHQRTKARVEDDRAKNRAYQDAYRERGRLHGIGDHRKCTKGCPNQGIDLRKALTHGLSKEDQSNPLSLLSDPKGGEREEIQGSSDGPLALTRRGTASDHMEIHVFVDYERTGVCQVCDMPKSNKRHQQDIPAGILRAARVLAEHGVAAKATEIHNDGEPYWDVVAANPDWGVLLSTDNGGKDLRINWAELRIPAARLGIPDTEFVTEWDDAKEAKWAAYVAPFLGQLNGMAKATLAEGVFVDEGDLLITVLPGARTHDADITDDLPVLLGLVPIAYAQKYPASTVAISLPAEPS